MNDDFRIDLSEAMHVILWMLLSGPAILPPFPGCGGAPGPEALDCPEGMVGYWR